MSTPRYRFYFRDTGEFVQGVVQGAGGTDVRYERLLGVWRLAQEGHEHGMYEPRPRHVRVYPQFSAQGLGPPVDVDLRRVVRIEPDGFSQGGP